MALPDSSVKVLEAIKYLVAAQPSCDGTLIMPTYREIAKRSGVKSLSHVYRHINALIEAGMLVKIPNKPRGIRFT